ncbi:putative transposase [Parvibaculum indicum]|uniref:zinc ribbon domain-containing protein n=1 Tax=Parvibaculum indicum TaxID=562969 RepID=UPI0014203EBE|nr:zinc ribbon domain-containing protein [Parvibaculum indicum]NIJ40237.1 putative transposase [Parvibaculum indicum]
MKDLHGPAEEIFVSGCGSIPKPASISVSEAQNNGLLSTSGKAASSPATRARELCVTLDPVSISGDQGFTPYWNARCAESQSMWWLPHQVGSRGQGSRSSATSSNFQEAASNFWKKTIVPSRSTSNISLCLSFASATSCTARGQVKGTRKIRVYPRGESFFFALIRQQRRAYNLAIGCFIEADKGFVDYNHPDLRKIELRRTIREFVAAECAERDEAFVSAWCDEAVLAAFRTREAVIGKRKNGESAGYAFRSLKDPRQRFYIQKLSAGFVAKQLSLSEGLPPEAFGKLTTIVFERGQWFICAQKHITTIGQDEIQARSIVAIDPGVRCFATAYSMNQTTSYGEDFYASRVFPLLLQIDKLIGQRARAKHDQWKRHYQKKIDRLVLRIRNLVDDLHRRVAYDLVQRFDIILLPRFETKQMSLRLERKIRTKTVRSMLGFSHYRFRQHLAWMCRKYGKRLIIGNEAYTSKTRSWDGSVVQNLGGAKTITDGKIYVDRDINGARGFMLRALYGNSGHSQATA